MSQSYFLNEGFFQNADRGISKMSHNNEYTMVLSIIKKNYERLTPVYQKVALFVLAHPGKILELNAAEISRESNTSEASVIRFCKEMGFKGFHDFKIKLAKDLGADTDLPVPENVKKDDQPWDVFHKVMTWEQENLRVAMNMIDKDAFLGVVDWLSQTGRIGFFAIGSSYPVAYDAFWRFSKIGIPCQLQQDSGAQIILAQSLKPGDTAFVITRSGQSRLPVGICKIARANGAKVIVLTQNAKSEAAKNSDIVLVSPKNMNTNPDGATASEIVHLALVGAIYSATTVRKWDVATENMKSYSQLLRSEQF